MLRTAAERWFRKRFTFPALVLLAGGLLVLSEITYQQTAATLRGGIGWTEARMSTARLLQLMTDVESAQRGYVLTGQAQELLPYAAARAELPQARRDVAAFLDKLGPEGSTIARHIETVTDEALAESSQVIALVDAGQSDAALALIRSGQGRGKMTALRTELAEQLQRAGRSQTQSRVTLSDALRANRFGVGALAALSVFGLFVFMRQLQVQDKERNQQRDLLAGERLRLEEEVRHRTADLRELASHLQTAREDERAHLARELHDELGGLLTAIKLDVARMRTKLETIPDMKTRLEHLNQTLNEGIAFKRRVIEDLRPSALANLGLTVSLEALCTDMGARLDIPVRTRLTTVRLTPAADLTVYRLVQEALTNIGKHADATEVSVTLSTRDDRAVIEVTDNGVGFDLQAPRNGHHGLTGMRFRVESLGGTLEVTASPGHGTTLRADFPVAPAVTEPAAPAEGDLPAA